MQRMTPHTYLRIAGYALTATVICLLMLYLASGPLDPVILWATLLFYGAAILALGGLLRSHYTDRRKRTDTAFADEVSGSGKREADSAGAPQPPATADAQPPEGQGQQKRSIIFLTKQDHRAREIKQNLSGWNHALDVVNSCAEASQQILNRLPEQGAAPRVILIVDTEDLELDPIHLPALIKQETALASLKLIGIVAGLEAAQAQQLKEVGFGTLLNAPIDKSLLFSAINSEENHAVSSDNVVNLTHYRQTQDQQFKKRILLADQHPADRRRLAALLRATGHRVEVVENGEQALDALERQHFDVALINLQLPVMNGTQVIKLHRFTTPHPQWVSFIVMTDQTTPATLRLCRDLQVKACLFKPVPTDALLEMIDAAPVIAPPLPAAVQRISTPVKRPQETRFLHADLLDIKVLQTLDQLDNDKGFVPDLIAIFARDSIVILQGMEEAVAGQDVKRYVELSNILMDNAGQLGAFALYEMCLTLQTMSQRDLKGALGVKFACLRELLQRTNQAFQHYLSELENQHSDQS